MVDVLRTADWRACAHSRNRLKGDEQRFAADPADHMDEAYLVELLRLMKAASYLADRRR